MKFRDYIGDSLVTILLYLGMSGFVFFFLSMFRVSAALTGAILVILGLFGCLMLFWGYFRKKSYYEELAVRLEQLEEKYLVSEMLSEPEFLEGRIFQEALYEIGKSMHEQVRKYEESVDDFKEYVEMWVHEVKLPIASSLLIMHNHPQLGDQRLKEQMNRIEAYAEQVLYYVRGENTQKDYLIKECSLLLTLRAVIRKNKDVLRMKGAKISLPKEDALVKTDGKWLEFMVNQIVSNSIKYAKENSLVLDFRIQKEENAVVLELADQGIGIPKEDLKRVFEKSFTGTNGRRLGTSTGIGLYLCRKLCDKLGHQIEIRSKAGEGTAVRLRFFGNEYYKVLEERR